VVCAWGPRGTWGGGLVGQNHRWVALGTVGAFSLGIALEKKVNKYLKNIKSKRLHQEDERSKVRKEAL